jgi:hypothetical protein
MTESRFSLISDAVPGGFFASVGYSGDSKILGEMLTGVRKYDVKKIKSIFSENPELAKKTANFFIKAADGKFRGI